MLGVCVLVLVATALPAACADGPARPPAPTESAPAASVPPGSAPPGSATHTEGAVITVRGTVRQGVEPHCLVLATPERDYLLLEAGPVLHPGVRAVVRGRPRPGMATTCMQATPFVVLQAHPERGGPS